MSYSDLREFLLQLEAKGQLKRIAAEVSPRLEMTEIADRVLRAGGPALLFERPAGHRMPVLANLFGTVERVALGGILVDPADGAAHSVAEVVNLQREPDVPLPGEVLVSRTVKDLVAGSGIAFEDFGVHDLKGIPEEWQVFRAIG